MSFKTVCLLLAVAIAAASAVETTPSASIRIKSSLIDAITRAAVPEIVKKLNTISIPGHNSTKISFSTINITDFTLSAVDVAFKAPNQISVQVNGVGVTIPRVYFNISDKIMGMQVDCLNNYLDMSMTNTNIGIDLTVTTVVDRLNITSAVATSSFGSLTVNQKVHGLCKLLESLVRAKVGSISKFAEKLIETKVPALIASEIEKKADSVFANGSFVLVEPAQITDNSMKLSIALEKVKGQVVPPVHTTMNFPRRDIEFYISQDSLDSILAREQEKNKINFNISLPDTLNTSALRSILPQAYKLCPDCPLSLELHTLDAPKGTFGANTTAFTSTNSILGLNAKKDGKIVDLVDFLLNATLTVSELGIRTQSGNESLFFNLGMSGFNLGLYRSNIGKIDIKSLSGLLASVVEQVVIPEFNRKFKGIPFQPIDGILLKEMIVRAEPQMFGVAGNIDLKHFHP